MARYDFFVAGRWRNHTNIAKVVDALRGHDKTVYCFIENDYKGEEVVLTPDDSIEDSMQKLESLSLGHPLIRRIFETDIEAQKASDVFLLVFPAGLAAHMEIGVSYGLGKPCYAIGQPDKTETLYRMFDRIFSDIDEFTAWLNQGR